MSVWLLIYAGNEVQLNGTPVKICICKKDNHNKCKSLYGLIEYYSPQTVMILSNRTEARPSDLDMDMECKSSPKQYRVNNRRLIFSRLANAW